MTDSALARDLLHALDTYQGTDVREEVRRIIELHPEAADPFGSGGVIHDALAGIEAAVTVIAQNTTRVPERVPAEQVLAKWPLRMHEDLAVPYVRALGIEVDE